MDQLTDQLSPDKLQSYLDTAVQLTLQYAPKLLLALQGDAEIRSVLSGPFVALTPKSIMDKDALLKRLALIRKRDWECAVDDVAVGLTALAVPVRNSRRELVGAVSMAGLTPQMMVRGKPVALGRLQEAAREIETRLA